MKLKRVFDVLFGEGLYTFKYLVKENLEEKKSSDYRYNKFIEKYVSKLEKIRYGNDRSKLGIIVWEGCNEKASRQSILTTIESIESQQGDVEYIVLKEGDSLKETIEKLKCDYVGFMTAGDVLCSNYVRAVLNVLHCRRRETGEIKLLYFDYIKSVSGAENKKEHLLQLLPDYSPDYLLNEDYIGENFIAAKDFLLSVISEVNGCHRFLTYQILLLGVFWLTHSQIHHVQSVLRDIRSEYVFSPEEEEYILKFKKKYLENENQNIYFSNDKLFNQKHIYYIPVKDYLVSIIIPSKDNPELVKNCLDSIEKYTDFTSCEIVLVDNGSSSANREEYKRIFDRHSGMKIVYIYEKMEFNFSRMCNIGAQNANGDFYLFLNDDIEVISPVFNTDLNIDWLGVMVGQAMQPSTGAVGAKLYFPDTKIIQHTGIINFESGAAHIYSRQSDEEGKNIKAYSETDCNYLAVTGACLMVSKEKFERVNGFSEELAVTFNDVELCMKLYEEGLYNIVRKDVILYHHESITRGEDALDKGKFRRHLEEREKLFSMHPGLVKYDPFYSPYLNQNRLDASVSTHYYINRPSKFLDFSKFKKLGNLDEVGKIHSAVLRENFIHVRGYGFKAGDKVKPVFRPYIYIKYKEKEILFDTVMLYEPTLKVLLDDGNNVDFATFYACIDIYDIDGDFNADCCELSIAMCDKNHVFLTGHRGEIIVTF